MSQQKSKASLDVNYKIAQSEAFIIKHKMPLSIATVALIVIIGGFFAFKYLYLEPREEQAQTLLATGEQYFLTGDFKTAVEGDKKGFPGYAAIADNYSMTDAANVAKAYAGICFAKTNQVKKAISYLEAYDVQDDKTISPAALGALADCYATDNQVDKAIATFQKAADLADNISFSPGYLLSAGLLLEHQKKNDEALKIYQRIKANYPASYLSTPIQPQTGETVAPEIDKYIERVSK